MLCGREQRAYIYLQFLFEFCILLGITKTKKGDLKKKAEYFIIVISLV